MSRHLVTLTSPATRATAQRYVKDAPTGTRVEFKAAKRSLPQNDKMWASLSDVSRQKEHCGRKYTPNIWKCIFMHALGRECEFVTSLDGHEPVPLGWHSSDLSKDEMSQLIEFIQAWGAQNGVKFSEPHEAAA